MNIGKLISEVRKYTGSNEFYSFVTGVSFKIMSLASGVTSLYIFKLLLEDLKENSDDVNPFLPELGMYGASLLTSFTFNHIGDYFLGKYGAKISKKMASEINAILLHYPLADLDLLKAENRPSADQMVDAAYKGMEPFIVNGTGIAFANLEFVTLSVFLSFFTKNKLSWIPLSWQIPLLIGHQALLATAVKYKFEDAAKVSVTSRLNTIKKTQESFANIVSVKIFNREQEELARFTRVQDTYYDNYIKKEWINTSLKLLHAVTVTLLITSALIYAGVLATDSDYKFGGDDFYFVASFAFQITAPFSRLGNYTIELLKGLPEALIALDVLESDVALGEQNQSIIVENNATVQNSINIHASELAPASVRTRFTPDLAISFSNVSFSYRQDAPVLTEINLNIKKGKLIAIVGASGSGKSTIAKLMLGLYQPTWGSIYFSDQQNVYEINRDNFNRRVINILRGLIGYVPQRPQLFKNTPLYNLRYAATHNPGADNLITNSTFASVPESLAISDAQLSDVFARHNQIDQDSLSGGELQRIGIARAFLRNPSIYIFDEITSGLDPHTSAEIIECFTRKIETQKNGDKKDTVIIVTHQLEKIRTVDTIVFVENNRILFETNSDNTGSAYQKALQQPSFDNFQKKTDMSFQRRVTKV